jgi:hypothetical protein
LTLETIIRVIGVKFTEKDAPPNFVDAVVEGLVEGGGPGLRAGAVVEGVIDVPIPSTAIGVGVGEC